MAWNDRGQPEARMQARDMLAIRRAIPRQAARIGDNNASRRRREQDSGQGDREQDFTYWDRFNRAVTYLGSHFGCGGWLCEGVVVE